MKFYVCEIIELSETYCQVWLIKWDFHVRLCLKSVSNFRFLTFPNKETISFFLILTVLGGLGKWQVIKRYEVRPRLADLKISRGYGITTTYSIPSGRSYPMARVSVPVWGEACRDCLHIDKDHAVGPPYYMQQVNQVWSAGNKEILSSFI